MSPKITILTNLCLIRKEDKILLALKKRGFGVGRWNGYGGKVQPGETIEEAMVREVKEESGLTVSNYHKVGFLKFDNIDRIVHMDIFETSTFEGDLIETEEMAPRWFPVTKLPFTDMWPSDPLWYPLYLDGKVFEGEVTFDKNHHVLSHNVRETTKESL